MEMETNGKLQSSGWPLLMLLRAPSTATLLFEFYFLSLLVLLQSTAGTGSADILYDRPITIWVPGNAKSMLFFAWEEWNQYAWNGNEAKWENEQQEYQRWATKCREKKKKKKQLGGEESELLQNPQTCLDLLKALCQHIGFNLANTATWPLSFLSTGEKKIVINWQLRIESNLSEEVWGKKSESVWHNP